MSDLAVDQGVVPALRITDYEASKLFYLDGLGFRLDWEHRFQPDLPVFSQISRGSLVFYLTQHTGDCSPGGLIHLFVPNLDAWHSELLSRGVSITEPPNESIAGLRDMTVTDPDGNKLRICQRVAR